MILPFFRFFRFSGRTGSGNPDLWAFLESLGQARSVGTHIIPVGSLGEPQLRQTGKTVFPDFRTNRVRKSGFMGIFGILRLSLIRGYPYHSCRCPRWATKEQNVAVRFQPYSVKVRNSFFWNVDYSMCTYPAQEVVIIKNLPNNLYFLKIWLISCAGYVHVKFQSFYWQFWSFFGSFHCFLPYKCCLMS